MAAQLEMRIATYNIRKARGNDGFRDPRRILEVVNRLEANIVVLQEADHRFGNRQPAISRELIAQETDFKIAGISTNNTSLGWHGNAMLLGPGVRAKSIQRLHLPSLEPRGAFVADLEMASGSFTAIGVHLALLRAWRRKQLRQIRQALDESQARQTMILGDFNEWSSRSVAQALGSAFSIAAPGKTFPAIRPMLALDKVAHGHGIKIQDCGVDRSRLATRSSDHLPVWANFSIAPPE